MKETRQFELKYIDVVSVFKFFGGISLIAGLIIGLFSGLLGLDTEPLKAFINRIFPLLANVESSVASGILFAAFYGLSAAVVTSIFTLCYNFFAALFGGLKFTLHD